MTESSPQSRLMVLMFTDVVGSVDLKSRLGDTAAAKVLSRHDAIFESELAGTESGELLQDTGDGFLVRFSTVGDAVAFALRLQHAMRAEPWGPRRVKVRVGIHIGEVSELEKIREGYAKISGLAVDLTARVMSLGIGGQILLTRAAFDNARQYVREHPTLNGDTGPEIRWVAHGPYVFKGSDDPVEIFEVGAAGLAPLREPPNTEKAKRAVRPGDEETLGWRPAIGLEVPGRTGWILDKRLGEGGFGEVWLSQHVKTQARRAFKFCFDVERLRSLKRELTLFRLIQDVLGERPDIAKLYEVRLDESPYFLECEFTELGNLEDWAQTQGGVAAIPLAQRLDFMSRISRAVAAAHSVGILHKDIKPANILMYVAEDAQVRPRLSDFGIGVLTDPKQLEGRNITNVGFTEVLYGNESSRSGTQMYAPPESLVGKPFTVQGDIYAMGVMLYQLIVGELDRPLASGWERDIKDPLLRDDIARCVAGDEHQRLTSAKELADRIDSLPQRRRTAKRRHIARLSAASLAILLALLTIVGALAVREGVLRRRAEHAHQNAEAIISFLKEMLYSPDPTGLGHDVKVKDQLEVASANIGNYADRPLIQASLHAIIGHIYIRLGHFDRAQPHVAGALQIRMRELGPPHADLAEALHLRGDWLWWTHRAAEALAMYDEALAMRTELAKGADSEPIAESLMGVAASQFSLGQLEQAEQSFRKALETRRRLYGERHRLVAASLSNLGMCLKRAADSNNGKREEAERCFREALAIVENLPDAERNPFDIGRAQHVLAMLLADQSGEDQWQEAESLFRSAIAYKITKAGESHTSVAASQHELAELLLSKNQYPDAADWAEQEIRILATLNPVSVDYANALILLGRIRAAQGDRDSARRLLNQASAVGELLAQADQQDSAARVRRVCENVAAEIGVSIR